jgi:hypothetical protein
VRKWLYAGRFMAASLLVPRNLRDATWKTWLAEAERQR